MSDHLKNNELFNELLRYRNNTMTEQERYQFERVLERDPFLEEALEGFELYKASDIEKDLASIDIIRGKKHFKLQVGRNLLIGIAAGVAILLAAFLYFQHRDDLQFARHKEKPVHDAVPLIDSNAFAQAADTSSTIDSSRFMLTDNNISVNDQLGTEKEFGTSKKASTPLASKTDTPRTIKKPAEMPTVMMSTLKTADVEDRAPGLVIEPLGSSDTEKGMMEEQQAPVITHANTTENVIPSNTLLRKGVNAQAQPLGGFDLFKQYIDREMVYPASESSGSRQSVKVQFTVTTTGQLTNFNVEKASENDDFNREAIRLLQSGPRWSPAVKDGIPVESRTEYRIVFRSR